MIEKSDKILSGNINIKDNQVERKMDFTKLPVLRESQNQKDSTDVNGMDEPVLINPIDFSYTGSVQVTDILLF